MLGQVMDHARDGDVPLERIRPLKHFIEQINQQPRAMLSDARLIDDLLQPLKLGQEKRNAIGKRIVRPHRCGELDRRHAKLSRTHGRAGLSQDKVQSNRAQQCARCEAILVERAKRG